MTVDLQIVAQAALVAITGYMARAAITEFRKIADTVAEHGRSLAQGNEKFKGMARDIEDLRDDVRELQADTGRAPERRRWRRRKTDR